MNSKSIKQSRFYKHLENIDRAIIVCHQSVNGLHNKRIRNLFKECRVICRLTLKRLFYKIYIGERTKNQKTQFQDNLYILYSNDNSNINRIKSIVKNNKMQIKGVVSENKYYEDYSVFIISNFNARNLVSIIINGLITLLVKIINAMIIIKTQS